ncbi:MAG TPA: ribosome biogenesis GTPase Der [Chloroflexota bacterium]|jgi:GTP-binding protein
MAIVALVGRPNVGKSTLFNRLFGQQLAVVEAVPGTTRDRIYADTEWSGRGFTIVDTGGIEGAPGTEIARLVRAQAQLAVEEADLLVLCVDSHEGLTADDEAVAALLRRSGKPIVVAATKADNPARRLAASDLYRLGFEEVIPVSAIQGTGTGDLLDWMVARLPPEPPPEEDDKPRFAIVGRPNVGKSSLLNALVGQPRSIVSDRPGTTRDAIDTDLDHDGHEVVLVDTAGIRRRGRIEVGVEKYSVIRALRAIGRADVVLVVLDADEGLTAQDAHLAGYVVEAGRGVVLVANKWDLVDKGAESVKEFDAALREHFKFMPWAPTAHVSALTKQRITRPLDMALEAYQQRRRRVPTAELNRVVQRAMEQHAPPSRRGRRFKVLYVTQAETEPPTFVLFVNDVRTVPTGYERYLENRIREAFGFEGTPVRLRFRGREAQAEEK